MGKVELRNHVFNTQKEGIEYYKEILNRNDLYVPLRADHDMLYQLLENHPEASQKIGCGVDYFSIGKGQYGTRCFFIHRKDNSFTDFSYRSAVSGKGMSLKRRYYDACRAVAEEQTWTFKKQAFAKGDVFCEISGEKLEINRCHVDHKYPMTFQAIADEYWQAIQPIDPMAFVTPKDNQFRTEWADLDLEDGFRVLHHLKADLRLLSPKINMSFGNREN